MVHGGLRYLENGEFKLVQESLVERDRLLRNAPHYVAPLPTTVPVFDIFSGLGNGSSGSSGLSRRPSRRGALAIKAGLSIYDFLTRKRAMMPRHQFRGRARRLKNGRRSIRASRVPPPITTPGSAIRNAWASNCCRTVFRQSSERQH
jgi:glycerol-3-phosphate dehydrogenase